MKIANIILTSQNGGAEQVFIDYQKILRDKLGHEIISIIKNDAPYDKILDQENIKYFKTSNNFGYYDFFAIRNIRKILTDNNVDAVLTHAGKASILTKKAIKNINHKKITHIAMNHSNNVKRSIGADYIFSINKEIFYKTIDLGQSEEKSIIIYNALNLENFQFEDPKINFDKNEIHIGIMARFDRTKGYPEILNAIKILNNKSNKKFILNIAGGGYFENEIKNEIKKLKIENLVNFLGWVEDKKKFFDNIDIFTLPSIEEPFGLVILEAMKYSCPIVSSDADGPKVILRNEIDGLITQINPHESYPQKLADNILKIINNKDLAQKIIVNSQQRLKEKFSFTRLERDLESVFGKNK